MLARTPLRVGSSMVWANPESGTVRFGSPRRNRTVLAGLCATSYLVGKETEVLVATAGSDRTLRFSLDRGEPTPLDPLPKPGWCAAVESTLGDPLQPVPGWLEIGVLRRRDPWYCSIPQGTLPRLQSMLIRRGLHMTYITRIGVDGR
ncbi:hypothetical protein [Streptomyces sp. B6B3]|uniref:hypothetical protein n=1 Tax=Streptomyces sp. B6B3 TaxID=3153570 RepID=UPI00325CC171